MRLDELGSFAQLVKEGFHPLSSVLRQFSTTLLT